jgi:hypothetical protein
MRQRRIPQPQRVRKIEGSFAWIDHRLLRHGHLAVMTPRDHGLYLFLCLAADRDGVSFYRQEKICDTLGMAWDEFHVARDRLIELKLIAFEPYSGTTPNGFYQVLPVDAGLVDTAAAPRQVMTRHPEQPPTPRRRTVGGRPERWSSEAALTSVAQARA